MASEGRRQYKIAGIPVAGKVIRPNAIRYYLFGVQVFKKKKISETVEYYLLGLRLKEHIRRALERIFSINDVLDDVCNAIRILDGKVKLKHRPGDPGRKKILLCRPRGGLNDMLCQIGACWDYAELYGRVLMIDTRRAWVLDNIDRYFSIRPTAFVPVVFGGDIESGDCFPPQMSGRLSSYRAVYDPEVRNYVEDGTRVRLTFDFSRDYSERVIVHEQCGGGTGAEVVLRRLMLKPDIASEISERIALLGDYSAVHVRNTDYKTDYEPFLRAVAEKSVVERIVLCTDDYSCQVRARDILGERLLLASEIPDTKGRPLHENPDVDRWDAGLSAICDLMVLACASKLHVTTTAHGFKSGFSMLAESLRADRSVVNSLLGRGDGDSCLAGEMG